MKNFLAALLLLLILFSCKSISTVKVQNGDLLFVTAKTSGLSGAINNVTQTQKDASFDHIGLVQKDNNKIFILHAVPEGGSQKQKFSKFLKDQRAQNQQVFLYRLLPQYQKSVPNAVQTANKMLGKPYNFDYILDENSYYCSDFIERAFRKDSIFSLQPMTFKDPSTGNINSYWLEFYRKRNKDVPEGQLGCNPNGLAASKKLVRIGEIK